MYGYIPSYLCVILLITLIADGSDFMLFIMSSTNLIIDAGLPKIGENIQRTNILTGKYIKSIRYGDKWLVLCRKSFEGDRCDILFYFYTCKEHYCIVLVSTRKINDICVRAAFFILIMTVKF